MKILELFAGTKSIGNTFIENGHEVFSIEWDVKHKDIDWYVDIGSITALDIVDRFGIPDVIWASPDCATYSIAALSRHRNKVDGVFLPKSKYAEFCDGVNIRVRNIINHFLILNPDLIYFIENPRGAMRHMNFVEGMPRYTVTYCQYGDKRMKPTDIFTNHPNPEFKPMCKNGDPCHEAAPRGSKTGTQGLSNSKTRSIIPKQLCEHIVDICTK